MPLLPQALHRQAAGPLPEPGTSLGAGRAAAAKPSPLHRSLRVVRRAVFFAHRWLGVSLALLLTVWFLSGIVMMYWSYPSVTREVYLRHAAVLNPDRVNVPPTEVFGTTESRQPATLAMTSFDGRPVYVGGFDSMFYADNGQAQRQVARDMVDRAASAWTGQPMLDASVDVVEEPDQWTLSNGLRGISPLYKYSWPDGQQVYVDGRTADIVQYTTRASRFWAYLGAIPHWLYVPALRTSDANWMRVMVWSSLLVIVTTLLGLAIAAWVYSPRRRYRRDGTPAAVPYSGMKRWHTIAGVSLGTLAVTWAFSGLMSLEPFGLEERIDSWFATERSASDEQSLVVWRAMGKQLLDRPFGFSAYESRGPREALRLIPDFGAKVLEFASLGGRAVYLATNGSGETRIVPVRGTPLASLDVNELAASLVRAGNGVPEIQVLRQYDRYYRDRKGLLPLPVIAIRMPDSMQSRYYVDPRTASVVMTYSDREWVRRWLHHGLHSLDLPWLYNHRPLWDIVMVTLLLAGTALCATSLALAYRAIARRSLPALAALLTEPDDRLVFGPIPVGEMLSAPAVATPSGELSSLRRTAGSQAG